MERKYLKAINFDLSVHELENLKDMLRDIAVASEEDMLSTEEA